MMNKQLIISAVFAGIIACGSSSPGGDMTTNEVSLRIETVLSRMKELCKGPGRGEFIQEFKDEDIAAWSPEYASKAVAALGLRGNAFLVTKDYVRAEKDYTLAVKLFPENGYMWNGLADVYRAMKDDQRALDAYIRAFEVDRKQNTAKSYGYMPISATLGAANILLNQARYQEALQVMARYDDSDITKMAAIWGIKMLRMQGQIYAGLGRGEESLAKFKAALVVEGKR